MNDVNLILAQIRAIQARLSAIDARLDALEVTPDSYRPILSVSNKAKDATLNALKLMASNGNFVIHTETLGRMAGIHQSHAAAAVKLLEREGAIAFSGKRPRIFTLME